MSLREVDMIQGHRESERCYMLPLDYWSLLSALSMFYSELSRTEAYNHGV
jgi:hypothetical protein